MPNVLRIATPMGDWRSFPAECEISAGMTVGLLYLIEETVGVCLGKEVTYEAGVPNDDPALGDDYVLCYHAEKIRVYKDASVFAPGDKVYWSGVDEDPVTSTFVSGYYWIGIAIRNALTGDATVNIDLKGDKATVGA